MAFVSAVNQPERVFLNSNDDTTPPTEDVLFYQGAAGNGFSRFTCRLPTPILKPKRTQLLRCAIPNAQVNIPDYDLVFWYYRLDDTSPPGTPPSLAAIRFLPTFVPGAPVGSTVPVNRQIASYQDLVDMLNAAAASATDPGNPYFVSGDIAFDYNAVTKKISWSGQTAGFSYLQAGYNDPLINNTARLNVFVNGLAGAARQPSLPQTSLNLRCGFTYYEDTRDTAILVPQPDLAPFVAPSWGNLVYSQCVYVFCNIVAGSGMGSGGQHNLLSVVPMNAPSLGVSLYQAPMVNWLTRVPDEIYEITIYMLDDNYQPFVVPNNAIVNVEMGFNYTAM